jgi:HD-like signal output (HDOD) protein
MPAESTPIRIDQEVFQQMLEKKLADLPPLPAVVTRIMQTVNNPDSGAEELNRLISLDQALSSKMLRIVNSAYYGFPKRIGTITHAIVILGFNTVRNLVLGVSAFGILTRKGGIPGLNRRMFWEHSVAAAVGSGIVARQKQPRNRTLMEQAFLGGLLHDIGELFLDCYFPAQYTLTLAHAARNEITMLQAEREVLGIDHTTIAARISETWNFPPILVASTSMWEEPNPEHEFFPSAATVHAADYFAWQAGYGSTEHLSAPPLCDAVAEWLGFTDADFEWMENELQSQFESARTLVEIAPAA